MDDGRWTMDGNYYRPTRLAGMGTAVKSIIGILYVLAALVGLLCVAYHVVFVFYSSLDGDPLSVLGIMLVLGNLFYPACIVLLLTKRVLKPLIYKPKVLLAVLLMVPIILWINYVLVETFALYDYGPF